MSVTPQMLLIVCPLIFLAALVDAIGGGGGLISLPAYLLAGLPPVLASGTNKVSASCGTLVACVKYFRSGRIQLKPALLAALGALPGAFLGAEILKRTPENFIRIFLLCAIPIMAVVLLIKRNDHPDGRPLTPMRLLICFLVGLGAGVYDGFFGPGAGTLLTMGLGLCAGMEMVTASGSAKLANLASNVGALASLLSGGYVLWPLALPAVACSLAGGYLGSALAVRRGARLIRYVMLGVLVLLILRLAYDYFPITA